MLKYIVILVIGVAVGYSVGYSDAKAHKKTVVQRVVERVGGSNRGRYNQDLDKLGDAVDSK